MLILWYLKLVECKVNSVQEACAKCFAVHILRFEIFQIIWKELNKEHEKLSFQFFIIKCCILMDFFVYSCGLQYINCKVFGESFLYWVDILTLQSLQIIGKFLFVVPDSKFSLTIRQCSMSFLYNSTRNDIRNEIATYRITAFPNLL